MEVQERGRGAHLFQFSALALASAAGANATYHEERVVFWTREYEQAVERVRATAGVEIKTYAVSGGERVDVVVNYGDPAAYKRMQEAWAKIGEHRQMAERYRSDAFIYGTQGSRMYELTAEDVHHFRLGGDRRPE